MDDNPLWPKVLEGIRKRLDNDHAFRSWFGPLKFVAQNATTLQLEVPDRFFKDWLTEHYAPVIQAAVVEAYGSPLAVEILVTAPDAIKPAVKAALDAVPRSGFLKGVFARPAEKTDTAHERGLNEKYTFDSFVVGNSNRFAYAASQAVSDSPAKAYNPLFIYGGVGLGKTHLMHAIGQRVLEKYPRSRILYISSEEFTNQLIGAIQNRSMAKFRSTYRNVDILLIDDIHFIAGKESTQEEFFHTFNTLHDAHKQIVVTSDRPPKEISALEARLVSRFEWGLVTDIQVPDVETRIAILKKKSERETVAVPDAVLYLLAEKIRTNIRELEGALIRVVAYAKLIGREITPDLVREVLKDMFREGQKKISVDDIQRRVAEYFNINFSDMKAKKRSRAVAYPRQIAMYLARHLTDYSLPAIGEYFGGRDHTTVIHACEKIEGDIRNGGDLRNIVDRLTQQLSNSV